MRQVDLMIDMETLGTTRDAIILSVGILIFDRHTGEILEDVYYEFDVGSQIFNGRTIDARTVAWWRENNPQELRRLLTSRVDALSPSVLKDILAKIRKDFRINKIWSRGSMDFLLLESIVGTEKLPYFLAADIRTLDVFGLRMGKNNHNALDDCKVQLKYLLEVLKVWNTKVRETTSSSAQDVMETS